MLKLKNLSKKYFTDELETTAVNEINLHIKEGDFISIMGPSGCGKSTLLNILGLLDTPTSGNFEFLSHKISGLNEKNMAEIRKENIGFIFQSFNLIENLTVSENVELPLIYQGISKKIRKERVKKVLERMKIEHRMDHFPRQLSGGQQQRVAISRAVVIEPKLILADEPTGNLDSENGKEVMDTLMDLNKSGTTIVMVTHSEKDASVASRNITLFDGRVNSESTS